MRKTLDRMAREMGLAVLEDVVILVQSNPFPMILVDRQARRAVVSAIAIRGEVFALVQKAW